MPIELLGRENFPALRALVERAWQRPRSDAYYEWRYFRAPGLLTLLLMHEGRCVATLSAFERAYRVAGRPTACLEPFDWYALPEARPMGAGLRLMRHLFGIGRDRPVLALGGTEDALAMLPKLGYRVVAEATKFSLPLSARYVLRNRRLPALAKRVAGAVFDRPVRAWYTPRIRCSAFGAPLPTYISRRALAGIDLPRAFASLPDERFVAWLDEGARAGFGGGQYVSVVLAPGGEPAAASVSRLYRANGLMYAQVFDARLAMPRPALADALVRETVRALAEAGADGVWTLATPTLLQSAYARAGFRAARRKWPVMVRAGAFDVPAEHVAISTFADLSFLPLAA